MLCPGRFLALRDRVRNWPWNGLWRIINIELLVDSLWYWVDLSSKLLFDLVEVETVIPVDQVDSQAKMAESTRAPNAMEICLGILREIEVDNHVDGLDINTASEQIRTDQITTDSIAKIVEDPISIVLQHTCVGIEARITKLCDLLCKQLYTICRVAENNRLVDLQL